MRFVVLAAAGFVGLAALTACKEEDVAEAKGSTTCDPATFEFLVGQDKRVRLRA